MSKYKCSNGCCDLIVSNFDFKQNYIIRNNEIKNRKKAGVFVFNSDKTKILLVQSRGKYWGPPKGTLEFNESWEECAKRELKEESGLEINEKDNFSRLGFVKTNAYYFCLERNDMTIILQDTKNNDANGIGWFSIGCVRKMLQENEILLNQHCKIGIKRIFNIDL